MIIDALHDYWYIAVFLVLLGYKFFGAQQSHGKQGLEITSEDNIIEKVMENYDLNVKPEDEKEITIKSIHIYPIRGVPGLEV